MNTYSINLNCKELVFLHTTLLKCRRSELRDIPISNEKENQEVCEKYEPLLNQIRDVISTERARILTHVANAPVPEMKGTNHRWDGKQLTN